MLHFLKRFAITLAVGILLFAAYTYSQETSTGEAPAVRYLRNVTEAVGGLLGGVQTMVSVATEPGDSAAGMFERENRQIRAEWDGLAELAKLPAECRGEAVERMPDSCLKPLLDLFLDTVDHADRARDYAEAKARDVTREMERRGFN